MESNTLTIGLVGGIASGKSLVAGRLAELGAVVLDADREVHEVLKLPEVITALYERWGRSVLDGDWKVNRKAIAAKVFGEGEAIAGERKFLEGLIHPATRSRLEAVRANKEQAGERVFVIDAPLLLEAGWVSACDVVLFVDTPRERRQAFASSRGWSAQEFASRESAQLSVKEKRKRADYVLPNAGTKEALAAAVDRFWAAEVAARL